MLRQVTVRIRRQIRKRMYRRDRSYRKFVRWNFVTNVAVSAQGVLATHGMLSVVGKASTEAVTSINYIGKDIIGQTAGLYYMSKMGKKADKQPKKFLKKSLVLQQGAILLESCTPLLPLSAFLPVAGIANMATNISFAGFGAVNAMAIQKLDKNNIGELYSRLAMINTIGSTIGMALGLAITTKVPSHTVRLMTVVPLLGVLRIYSVQKSIEHLFVDLPSIWTTG